MSDSTSPLDKISTSQGGKEVTDNELSDSFSPSALYARKAVTSAALTWGYYGGRYKSAAIANGTLSLTASATNYIVAARSNGAVSVSTAATNWNDQTNYIRLYLVVAGASTVTSYEDHRQGIHGLDISLTNPMTTAGDIIKGGASGAPERLAVGSEGQVLKVTSGAPAWGSDVGFANPMTTAGDIITGGASGAAQRLAVGTNGQVLKVVSGAPAWATDDTGTAVPAGGTTGQALKKVSNTDYDVSWQNDDTGAGLPVGGSTGQVLRKVSGTNYDVEWATPATTQGKHAIYIAAGSMRPSVTGGCAALTAIASAANQPDIVTLDFDTTTQEYAQFSVVMPKKWNEGTVTFKAHWSHAATTTNFGVAFDLQAVAVSDDDAIAVAYGTAVVVTDTGGTTNDLYTTAESGAITVAGTPQAEDTVFFRLSRVVADAADTMAIDARLHGITLYVTTHAETDA